MRSVIFVLLIIFIGMESFSQNRPTDRNPAVAGRFYAANKEVLHNDVAALFKDCKKTVSGTRVRAVISPHAGYVFSGKVAAAAYSAISPEKTYKNIFIIGSSHVMAFEGASVYSDGDFITPLGKMIVNQEIASRLKDENKLFRFPGNAHIRDHCLEVQLPFLQYHLSGSPAIVPIIIGTNNQNNIRKIAEILQPWFNSDNLFVISSDFSHYPPYKSALEIDKSTAEAIIHGDPDNFLNVLRKNSQKNIPGLATSMCGWTSGLLLLYMAQKDESLEFKHIDYCNSGDSRYGDKQEVVGYHAIVLVEKESESSSTASLENTLNFSPNEKEELLSMARKNIRSLLYDNRRLEVLPEKIPPVFNKPLGAFVTIKIEGKLRGCIGRFISSDPLYEVVLESSKSSAFEDPRFSPLTREEFEKTDLEITVLGPLKKIDSPNEIILGKHGIYIKKDYRSGTMLPQVATENRWNVEEFLGYTSRDKAGIGWNGWKDAEVFIYEGIVFDEKGN